jgi:hypothetical protein
MNLANSVMMSSQKHLMTNKQKTKNKRKQENKKYTIFLLIETLSKGW